MKTSQLSINHSFLNCLNILQQEGLVDYTEKDELQKGIINGDKKSFFRVNLLMETYANRLEMVAQGGSK